jgi:hypothetical protein
MGSELIITVIYDSVQSGSTVLNDWQNYRKFIRNKNYWRDTLKRKEIKY